MTASTILVTGKSFLPPTLAATDLSSPVACVIAVGVAAVVIVVVVSSSNSSSSSTTISIVSSSGHGNVRCVITHDRKLLFACHGKSASS